MFLGTLYGAAIHDYQITLRVFAAVRYALKGIHYDESAARYSKVCFVEPSVAITEVHDEIIFEGDTTEAGLELDILKVAIVNPALFQSLRQVFLNHDAPDNLDETGRKLFRIYSRLEDQFNGKASAD